MNDFRKAILVLLLLVCILAGKLPADETTESYETRRNRMIDRHIVDPYHGASITDTYVIEAMRNVPRHKFVLKWYREFAYRNQPLPIGHDQTISQPYIVALMTQLLRPDPGDKILEVGTGSGYQAAVLAEIVDQVYSIEIIPELAKFARKNLSEAGYETVTVKQGDGYHGWKEHAPFDGIIVMAAPDTVPEPLKNQLKPGGRLVIPVGPSDGTQRLMTLEKRTDGSFRRDVVIPVRFVPFLRSETS
jgi:protein-L-isoaspartate(D-aspartate) O-methyltransferase